MKVKRFIEKAKENWVAKVICFVTALLFYAFYRISTLEKHTFTVPVTIHAESGIVAASAHTSDVRVTVRAKPDDIVVLRDSDFSAYVDLDYLASDGTYRLPIFIRLSETALSIDPLEIQLNPERIELTVEEQISGYVPVSPLVSGTPAHGYEVTSVTVKPHEVRLTGPHSMVEHCHRLQTKTISVEGLSATTTLTTALEPISNLLQTDADETVTVTVEIAPVVIERVFERLPVVPVNVSSRLEAHCTETSSLTLRGTMLALERYTPTGSVLVANCAGVTTSGRSEVPLSARVPSQFQVVSELPRTVNVLFREKAPSVAGESAGAAE